MKDGNGRLMLARLGDARLSAERFQLFRTAERLSDIQRELIRFKDAQDGPKAHALIRGIEEAKEGFATEYEEVGVSNRAGWRSRRGLISVCALFAAQAANLGILLFSPETFGSLPDAVRTVANRYIAAALVALAAFPVRDFAFSYRFGKVKDDVESVLGDIKKEALAYLGSTMRG
jgi:hypothetical protein